jgi:phosphotransferase system HPr (HPr) family protein
MSRSSENASCKALLPAGVALHARPAARFVTEAHNFGSSISVTANGRQANAKSILEVLLLGATGGTELYLTASGEDAVFAITHLAAFLSALS